MAAEPNYDAFMDEEKMRSESNTLAGVDVDMFEDRRSILNPVVKHRMQVDQKEDTDEESAQSTTEGSNEFEEDFEEDDEDVDDNQSQVSTFSVQRSKKKLPHFPDRYTGYRWCKRRCRIIEKVRGEKLKRQITLTDDPHEYARYLLDVEEDAYVDSTVRWMSQIFVGVCQGFEGGSRFIRNFAPKAPNLDGLVDNNLSNMEDYEVIFMELDESLGQRVRNMDPIVRLCFMFLWQMVVTAGVNYGMGKYAAAMKSTQEGGGGGNPISQLMNMAQNMSTNVLDGMQQSNGEGKGNNDFGEMLQQTMKSMMPMMQNFMGQGAATAETKTQDEVPVIDLEKESLQIVEDVSDNNDAETNNDTEEENDDEEPIYVKPRSTQSRTVNLEEYD